MRSTGTLATTCAACRAPGRLEVGEEFRDGHLRWFERLGCPCGHGYEAGDSGLPSPAVRRAIIEASGRAELWVDDAASCEKVRALLVDGLGLPAAEVHRRFATLPALAWDGPPAEAAFLGQVLRSSGASLREVSFPPGTPAPARPPPTGTR